MRWLVADVIETVVETPRAVTLRLDIDGWPGHRPGQHVDLRLTAEDGYSAQRSYSIASPPETTSGKRVELTVVRLEGGEVSPYLTTILDAGDRVEVRGPIGGYFVWDGDTDERPVLLVGGGSGVVPLMAILRRHRDLDHGAPLQLVYSARSFDDVLYRAELEVATTDARRVTLTLTREEGAGWTGRRGRVDRALLAAAGWPPEAEPRLFVCGPTPFVEAVANDCLALGHPATSIRTERFGASGG